MWRSQKLTYLFLIILFFSLFLSFNTQKVFAYTELDVAIVNNNLRINSCSSNLPRLIGYKGYINDVEIFTTGPSGGFPCYSGDLFISGLKSFIFPYTGPLTLSFNFYATTSFTSPIIAHFEVYYNGSEFSTTPPAPHPLSTCSDGIQNQDETSIDTGGVCEIIAPPPPLPACTENCFSNILFLPGMMGSRLYDSNQNQLWFSVSDLDHSSLLLDNQGKSIDSAIYTKSNGGIIDEIFGLNIYKSFMGDLESWKEEGTIEDYAFVPYDWRLSLDDIITNGFENNGNISYSNSQDFSESFILKKLEELQASSKSGKVTIVTHSNGGLVAKALVQKLKDTGNPLYEKIDKIIFVAVPQIGTPDAVVALLHGTEMGPFGAIMDKNRSRELSENMPTVYNLLPSKSYFDTVDPEFASGKIISFEDIPFFTPQTSQYGVFISNETELENYILGTDGRPDPSFDDTLSPNIGNPDLYENAKEVHQILDSWEPHGDTQIIQVAGWGAETLVGLDYRTYRDVAENISYVPRLTIDGDSTVVVPSALWMSESDSNVERWWVNLQSYDTLSNLERIHRDILEIPNLNELIKSKIIDLDFNDSENIVVNNTSTLVSNDSSRLHFILHSPLTLGVTDEEGNYTGMDPDTKEIKEEIPDVDYRQIGEVQFLSIPKGSPYTLMLQGYADGYFSLDVEEQAGNEIIESTLFEGIQSSASTFARMDIIPDFDVSDSQLQLDIDGDEIIDQIYPIVEIEVPQEDTNIDTTIKEEQSDVAPSSSSGSVSTIGTEKIAEESQEPQWENEILDVEEMQERTEPESQANYEQKIEEITQEKNIENEENLPLTALVVNSGVDGSWVWYVIIVLSVIVIMFLIKKFIKI